jgi:hypothetical protein
VKINPGDHLLVIDLFENDTVAILKQKVLEKSIAVSDGEDCYCNRPCGVVWDITIITTSTLFSPQV